LAARYVTWSMRSPNWRRSGWPSSVFATTLDLTTPSGRLMFHVVSAMAGFERALIQERVRAGLRNARAKGKRLGRPRVFVSAAKIADLRKQGRSWAQIVGRLGSARARHSERCPACPKNLVRSLLLRSGQRLDLHLHCSCAR
jgi:DNA invertase Pin-like site-specific DNA recombinase